MNNSIHENEERTDFNLGCVKTFHLPVGAKFAVFKHIHDQVQLLESFKLFHHFALHFRTSKETTNFISTHLLSKAVCHSDYSRGGWGERTKSDGCLVVRSKGGLKMWHERERIIHVDDDWLFFCIVGEPTKQKS